MNPTATIIPNGSTEEVTLPVVKRSAFVLAIELGIAAAQLHAKRTPDVLEPLSDEQIAALRAVGQTATVATTGDFIPHDPEVSPGCPWSIAFNGNFGSGRNSVCGFACAFDSAIGIAEHTVDFVIA